MRIVAALVASLACAAAFADAEPLPVPVRNPFWPIGYEGERAVITAEPRVKIALPAAGGADEDTRTAADVAASAAATMMAESATSQHWIAARKTLSVGSPLIVKGDDGTRRSSVMINGKAYADGDYVSITHSGRRFTWKVLGLNDSDVLKLVRVRVRKVEEPDKDAAKQPEKGKTK